MVLFGADLRATMRAIDRSRGRIEFTPDGTVLTANANFLDLLGYSLAEVKGRHHALFVSAEERASQAYFAFWKSLQGGEPQTREFKRISKDGRTIWIQATYSPVFDRAGRVTRIVKFASDVTAQVMQTIDHDGQLDALHRSQAVVEFDLDGTILAANRNFLDTVGYRLDEVEGRHHSLFVDPAERETAEYRSFWDRLRRGEFASGEFRRIAKGGHEIWIQATYNPIRDRDGVLRKVVKFATDVTARKLETADATGQLAAVRRSQAVIEFAPDGTVLEANENFLNAFGYRLEEVRGQPHAMFVEAGYRQTPEYAAFWERLCSGAFFTGMFQRYNRDGHAIWIQASYNPIFDPVGRLTKIVKYAIDVSANMHARSVAVDAAERTLDHVQAVTVSIEAMNAAALEISQSMAHSKAAVDEIHGRTGEADAATMRLQAAASDMGGVAGVIAGIAQQINLLALNATIEAARAGTAGKGFAVVASEVKELAGQAAAATTRISSQVVGMQAVSSEVATTLASITRAIGTISEHVDGVSASMNDQTRATADIFASVQQAASGVAGISTSLDNWTVGLEERRNERRTRVLLPAHILTPSGERISCAIRDLSEGGARISLQASHQISERFELIVDEDGRQFQCEVCRQSGANVHLKFVSPQTQRIA